MEHSTDMAALLLAMNNNNGGGFAEGVALGASLNNNRNGDYGHHGYRHDFDQNQANMSLMQSIGQVDKAVAVSTADLSASQALQSSTIQAQLSGVAASLTNSVRGVGDMVNSVAMHLSTQITNVDKAVMENRYELMKDLTADGEKTRVLITSNYQDTLNRQLGEANAALIELRSEDRANRRAFDSNITMTQTVNQAQTQTQTQGNFDRLYHLLHGVGQNIRDTNTAINFGAGTLTNTNTPTNTNNSVGGIV